MKLLKNINDQNIIKKYQRPQQDNQQYIMKFIYNIPYYSSIEKL